MKMITKNVASTLFISDKQFPVLSYRLMLAIGALPKLSVAISMGDSMSGEGLSGEPVDMSAVVEGADVVFTAEVGSQKLVYRGVVGTGGLNVTLSATGNSSGTYQIDIEHTLAKLGGLPIIDRVFIGAGREADTGVDAYRWELLYGHKGEDGNIAVISDVMNSEGLEDGLENLLNTLDETTIPGLVLKCVEALYISEIKEGEYSIEARSLDTGAVGELKKLMNNVVGGVPIKSLTKNKHRAQFMEKLLEKIASNWGSSNGLGILMGVMKAVFFAISPRQNGDVLLVQNCPALKTEKYTINNSDILGISYSSVYDAVPIAGIRIKSVKASISATMPESAMEYIQYPVISEGGIYKYISTDAYEMWFSFGSVYTHQKDPKNKKSSVIETVNTSKVVEDSVSPITEQKTKSVPEKPVDTEKDSLRDLHLNIGKAVYALQKWANSSIVLSIAHVSTIEVGDVVKIDLTTAKALAANIPKGIYFGFVETVALAGVPGKVTMQVNITNVRSAEDNDKYGLEEYPIYEAPK